MTRGPGKTRVLVALLPLFAGCSSGGSGDPGGNAGSGGAGNGTGGSASTGGRGGMGGSGGTGTTGGSGGGTAGIGGSSGSGGAATGGGGGGSGAAGGGGGAGDSGSAAPDGADASGAADAASVACPTPNEEKFSFFLVSNKALIREGGADSTGMFSKLGGNLGGIAGADAICQRVAEFVSPCQKSKVWHAFLSTTTVDAIDRIGAGPWYDRNGRRWASSLATVMTDRPSDADPAIKNDPPNEEGVPNHNPDGTGRVDNHEILTGTGTDGRLYRQSATPGQGGGSTQCGRDVGGTGAAAWSAERATCWNWTRNTPEGCPRVGRSWCTNASCTPPGSGSGTNWMSVWNEGGCAPGGTLAQTGGLDGTRRVGSAGGYGGFFCFAVVPQP
jgi:hypothetical protein